MDPIRVIEVKESIFADNNADAERLRGQLKKQGYSKPKSDDRRFNLLV